MRLISTRLLSSLPCSKEVLSQPFKERIVYHHFYNPITRGDWYVLAVDKKEGDFYFYGYIYLNKFREDYFTLKELEKIKLPFDAKITRNSNFKFVNLSDLIISLGHLE